MSHNLSRYSPFFPHDALFLPSTWRAIAGAESSSPSSTTQQQTTTTSGRATTRGSHVSENDDRILLTVDVPGVKSKQLHVKIENGVLSISGCRTMKLHHPDPDQRATKKFKFCKTFAIDSHTVDVTQAKANLADGVLVFTAPKKAKPDCIVIPVTEDPNEESDSDEDSKVAIKAGSATSGSDEEVNVVTTVKDEPVAAGMTGEEK